MGRTDKPIIPFIDACVARTSDGKQAYKGFKVQSLLFSAGIRILIMTILFPRKKRDFNAEFEDLFKDYESYRKRKYEGYAKKDNIKAAIKKNKKLFQVLFNAHGIFIFRRRLDSDLESLMDDETFHNMKSPYSVSNLDCDKIEDFYEKVMTELILPKFEEKLPNVHIEIDLSSCSSGYGSSISYSPFSDNLSLPSNSPDSYKVEENSLPGKLTEGNSSLLTPFSSGSDIIWLENTMNSSLLQNLPSTSKELLAENVNELTLSQNCEIMETQEESSDEQFQINVNNLISETLKDYTPSMAEDSSMGNNVLSSITEVPSHSLNHNCSTANLNLPTVGVPLATNPQCDNVNIGSSFINKAPCVDIHQNSRQYAVYIVPYAYIEAVNPTSHSEGHSENFAAAEQHMMITSSPQSAESCNVGSQIFKEFPSMAFTDNLTTNINDVNPKNFPKNSAIVSESNRSEPISEYSGSNDLCMMYNSSSESVESSTVGNEICQEFQSSAFSDNSGTIDIYDDTMTINYDLNPLNFLEDYSVASCTETKKNELILGVLSPEELFQKHHSMTNNIIQKKHHSYPSMDLEIDDQMDIDNQVGEWCQEMLESHEKMDEFKKIFEEMVEQSGGPYATTCTADYSAENLHDPSYVKHRSTFSQMFGNTNSDSLNAQHA